MSLERKCEARVQATGPGILDRDWGWCSADGTKGECAVRLFNNRGCFSEITDGSCVQGVVPVEGYATPMPVDQAEARDLTHAQIMASYQQALAEINNREQ